MILLTLAYGQVQSYIFSNILQRKVIIILFSIRIYYFLQANFYLGQQAYKYYNILPLLILLPCDTILIYYTKKLFQINISTSTLKISDEKSHHIMNKFQDQISFTIFIKMVGFTSQEIRILEKGLPKQHLFHYFFVAIFLHCFSKPFSCNNLNGWRECVKEPRRNLPQICFSTKFP